MTVNSQIAYIMHRDLITSAYFSNVEILLVDLSYVLNNINLKKYLFLLESVVKRAKPGEEIKLYYISVEQEMTSSHWKVVCKQRLHCFDTSGESVYHIKP